MNILALFLLIFIGASCGDGIVKDNQVIDAKDITINDKQKECDDNFDCEVFNKSCCGSEDGFEYVNRRHSFILVKMKQDICAQPQDPEACKDKVMVPRTKYPAAACVNKVCAVKSGPDVSSLQSKCSMDAECVVLSNDCCENRALDQLMAVNWRYEREAKLNKAKECKPKFDENPKLCLKSFSHTFLPIPPGKCENNACVVGTFPAPRKKLP